MCAGAIALVPGKTVLWEFLIHPLHETVPCHLRNHAGCCDGHGQPVAFHKGFVRHTEAFHRKAVDQRDVRLFYKGRKRKPHRKVGGAEDVDCINLLRADHFHRPDDGWISGDLGIQEFPALFGELLGIV